MWFVIIMFFVYYTEIEEEITEEITEEGGVAGETLPQPSTETEEEESEKLQMETDSEGIVVMNPKPKRRGKVVNKAVRIIDDYFVKVDFLKEWGPYFYLNFEKYFITSSYIFRIFCFSRPFRKGKPPFHFRYCDFFFFECVDTI